MGRTTENIIHPKLIPMNHVGGVRRCCDFGGRQGELDADVVFCCASVTQAKNVPARQRFVTSVSEEEVIVTTGRFSRLSQAIYSTGAK